MSTLRFSEWCWHGQQFLISTTFGSYHRRCFWTTENHMNLSRQYELWIWTGEWTRTYEHAREKKQEQDQQEMEEDEEQGNSKEKEKPLDDHIDTKVYEDKVNIGHEENGTCEGNLHCVSLARSFYPTSNYSFSLQIIIMFKQR